MPKTAVIIADMLNTYDHEDAGSLAESVKEQLPSIRGYEMVVPPDAVAHIDAELAQAAFKMMQANMHAELTRVADLKLDG